MYNNTSRATLSPNERLFKAADYGDLEGVKKAIEDRANLLIDPLIKAAERGHIEIFKFIINNMELEDFRQHSIGIFRNSQPAIAYLVAQKVGFSIRDTKELVQVSLAKHDQLISQLNSKIENESAQIIIVKQLLEAQNLAIAQIQSKNDLIAHKNEIISQHNQTVLELKGELAKLQEQVKSLTEDKTLTIEINDHERQLQELKQEVTSLKVQLSKSRLKDKSQNAVTIQALARGFLSRKHHSLTSLKEQRKSEIQMKLPEAMTRFAASGKYGEITKLAEAMKDEKLHQAIQIVRGKPEREIAAGSRRIKY